MLEISLKSPVDRDGGPAPRGRLRGNYSLEGSVVLSYIKNYFQPNVPILFKRL